MAYANLTSWSAAEIQIGIVSDTHGFLDPRIASIVSQCDIAVHAGDIGSAAVLDSMQPKSKMVIAVAGNNDTIHSWALEDKKVLSNLAEEHQIGLEAGLISVEHGHKVRNTRQYHEELRGRYGSSRMIIYGHTHKRVVDTSVIPWVVNPGASGKDRTYGGPSCLTLRIHKDEWTITEHVFPLH